MLCLKLTVRVRVTCVDCPISDLIFRSDRRAVSCVIIFPSFLFLLHRQVTLLYDDSVTVASLPHGGTRERQLYVCIYRYS